MTWSIIARDRDTGQFGIAVASCFFAVGALAPYAALTAADIGRDHRQLHVMDAKGHTAAHTGNACIDWCGHLAGDAISVAGNSLVGASVVEDTAAAYAGNAALSFPRRLITAMRAGEAAGGDKRGRQSAALVICGEEEWPDLNLRVDDHPDPLAELERPESFCAFHANAAKSPRPGRRDRPWRNRKRNRKSSCRRWLFLSIVQLCVRAALEIYSDQLAA